MQLNLDPKSGTRGILSNPSQVLPSVIVECLHNLNIRRKFVSAVFSYTCSTIVEEICNSELSVISFNRRDEEHQNGNRNWHPSLKLPIVLGILHCSLSESTSSYDYLYHIFHRLATFIWENCSLDIYNDNSSYYTYLFPWFHYNIY